MNPETVQNRVAKVIENALPQHGQRYVIGIAGIELVCRPVDRKKMPEIIFLVIGGSALIEGLTAKQWTLIGRKVFYYMERHEKCRELFKHLPQQNVQKCLPKSNPAAKPTSASETQLETT